jgi:hypothetical protein
VIEKGEVSLKQSAINFFKLVAALACLSQVPIFG